MKVRVDADKCISCGMCVSICPDSFRMNDDYKSEAIAGSTSDCISRAAENCPTGAIIIEE